MNKPDNPEDLVRLKENIRTNLMTTCDDEIPYDMIEKATEEYCKLRVGTFRIRPEKQNEEIVDYIRNTQKNAGYAKFEDILTIGTDDELRCLKSSGDIIEVSDGHYRVV